MPLVTEQEIKGYYAGRGVAAGYVQGRFVSELHRHFIPNKILLLADSGEGQKFLEEKLEAFRGIKPIEGKSAAYVCENFTCQAPVTDPKALGELLGRGD